MNRPPSRVFTRHPREAWRFIKKLHRTLEVGYLFALVAFLWIQIPADLLNTKPATGGDMGSHFWPLYTLTHYGLPHFTPRIWNPGNLGGEPHFVHYFPLPYFLMAAFSAFLPLGMAFNIGTFLPVMALPFAVFASLKLLRLRFPAPIIASASSLTFVFNESFSMWGGNALSTLAGQFAHAYALVFFVLLVGVLGWELRTKRSAIWSGFVSACVTLSHSYVMLGIPFLFLGTIVFGRHGTLTRRLLHCFKSGMLTLGLTLWFLVPMLTNAPWQTAFSIRWNSANLLREAVPEMLYPALGSLLLGIVALTIVRWRTGVKRSGADRQAGELCRVLVFPILGFALMYFLFPLLGLVDVRALPQIQLFATVLGGLAVSFIMQRLGTPIAAFLSAPTALIVFWFCAIHISNLDPWMRWNYSGWESKPTWNDLKALSTELQGTFSDPRVVYEHTDLNNSTGTVRVFEMLPYFTGRSTLESVYLQATILALEVFHIQAEVSKTPSCPFPQMTCVPANLASARDHLELMGVGDLILASSSVLAQARSLPWLAERGKFGFWHHFSILRGNSQAGGGTTPPSPYVQVLRTPIDMRETQDWKSELYQWFRTYSEKSIFFSPKKILSTEAEHAIAGASTEGVDNCNPSVEVSFQQLVLHTNCPGKAHILKFAYHPTWKSSGGEPLFLVSPGFIGVVPQSEHLTLHWGENTAWRISGYISSAAWLGFFAMAGWQFVTTRRRHHGNA